MTTHAAAAISDDDRPTTALPMSQLFRMSLYWFGLSSIFIAVNAILAARLEFEGLVAAGEEGRTLFALSIGGVVVAALVQPTIGSISDYTISRWGRRKPYILIGTVLDVVFLVCVATSNTLLAIAVFMMLLQFSSNFAQGPFQGYVPDLVPAKQVGTASALVGMMQVLGNVGGIAVAAIAVATNQFALGLIAVGILELVTMISVFVWVQEGRTPKDRAGRSWMSVAREAWGLDILKERSFLWLIASRFMILMAGGLLTNLALWYLLRSQGLTQEEAGLWLFVMTALIAVAVMLSVVPAARISDRVGRKKVIYVSCAIGAAGLAIVAAAPSVPIALAGVVLYGISAGVFLSVDWALLTDIIPKASSGRFMGISNLATATNGVIALALGGTIMDLVGGAAKLGSGPRTAVALGIGLFLVGALLLRPVVERRRELEADQPLPFVPEPVAV
jgi:MFS family permease